MAFRHFLVGVAGGVVGGIYIAQNYEVSWLLVAKVVSSVAGRGC